MLDNDLLFYRVGLFFDLVFIEFSFGRDIHQVFDYVSFRSFRLRAALFKRLGKLFLELFKKIAVGFAGGGSGRIPAFLCPRPAVAVGLKIRGHFFCRLSAACSHVVRSEF